MTQHPLPRDPLDLVLAWAEAGRPAALATVVATWGSSPRPSGSMMAIDATGRIEGSVSGGCVEASVVDAAESVMRGGVPELLSYGVTSEQAWAVGLACGGELDVLVESVGPEGTLDPALLRQATALRRERRPALLATRLTDMHHILVERTAGGHAVAHGGADLPAHLLPTLDAAFRGGRSARHEAPDGEVWFLHLLTPPHRLLIVGAVHIAQVLAPLAAATGFAVTVIDPRTQLATPERFPGIPLVTDWPDEALAALEIDDHTAIVTLTHDAKLDDPTLRAALDSPAFYIGALGSRKTQASRLNRLREAGYDDARAARIHGPVGLAIGAIGAPEIALSILAQIVAVRRDAPLARRPGWT
ncbi:xanthine dehydrogenase accessory factor XdhC/CoxI [Gluconacetobacter johannae DSM 13595]|uniref:XdhC family protein n=1 Tax=Gluconacetobacter johannae TaxID=112140 RepID=A0A7W4P4X0_9PROT|nr:XdhC/CoxI family protein [Gluconacetobacter johannae]MBB2177462.1 XdhC family protein [Gluconacetobacter johannae]GBQ82486.1 xanthine dehydrogenase accessory factor XdhC/CoxI [Gluconacetobacter johannae DSM 13595]